MARKYARKFKRLKKESQSSKVVLSIRAMLKDMRVRLIIGVVLMAALISGIYLYNKYHKYDSYKVVNSIKIESGANSKYVPFGKFVVKYSSDGISYIDGKETIWDEAYEMKAPIVDVCESYLAICDKNANDIFLYNEDGRQGKITTTYPIVKLEVAEQGVVAALLEDKDANYIEVYDKEGKQLVSHKTLIDENGYPLNFSLSNDGTKMLVTYLSVNSGTISNKILFYNFSKAGKNSSDRMVGGFEHYKEIIVPTVQFVSNDDAIAVGENVLSIYKMKNKPTLKKEVNFNDEVHKVFYDEDYVGLVFENTNSKNPYRLEIYNLNGSRVMKTDINMYFDTIKFAGKNVVVYNDMNCQIISLKGIKKFEHTFKEEIKGIIPIDGSRTYLFMTSSAIEKIRLK
ncbi:MAG: DUF5711 family protein [Eubacterium sp.]